MFPFLHALLNKYILCEDRWIGNVLAFTVILAQYGVSIGTFYAVFVRKSFDLALHGKSTATQLDNREQLKK